MARCLRFLFAFNDLSPSLSHFFHLKRDCKNTTFSETDKIFFSSFPHFFCNLLCINKKIFQLFFKKGRKWVFFRLFFSFFEEILMLYLQKKVLLFGVFTFFPFHLSIYQ